MYEQVGRKRQVHFFNGFQKLTACNVKGRNQKYQNGRLQKMSNIFIIFWGLQKKKKLQGDKKFKEPENRACLGIVVLF